MATMKILIINGPNLNHILERNKDHYGEFDISKIENLIKTRFHEIDFDFFTSNDEHEILFQIQSVNRNYDGLIINPGAYSHSSIGIRDALEICKLPKIEIHLSNLSKREKFRNVNLSAVNCDGYIAGFKDLGYLAAVFVIRELVIRKSL